MNLNQITYFISVAQLRSFSAAAEENYVTQTAMTQQIRALEETVGCQLIDRSRRPIALTAAGKSFFNDAKQILARMNEAVERANEASTGVTGTLRIGYLKGYERSALSDQLRLFHREVPNVLMTCRREASDRLAAGLQNDEYDIIFTWDSTNLKMNAEYRAAEIEKARLVAAVYASHPYVKRASLSRKDFRGEPIIYMSPSELSDNYGDSVFMELYHKAGYSPNIIFRSTDVESVLIMVAAEEGISILPDYCVKKITDAEGLVFIPMDGEQETEEIHAVWKKTNDNPALHRYISFMNSGHAQY